MKERLLKEIESIKGIKYTWGGESPKVGFDTSGLVQYLYSKLGIELPRSTYEQVKQGVEVKGGLEIGDLVFFGEDIDYVYHVGVYVGNNEIVHAYSEGETVGLMSLNTFGDCLIVRRILN